MKGPAVNAARMTEYLAPLDATDAQRDEIRTAAATLARIHGDGPAFTEALKVATTAALNDGVTEQLVENWKSAQRAVEAANTLMRAALAVEVARSNESAVAARFGVSRPTVRKAVGK